MSHLLIRFGRGQELVFNINLVTVNINFNLKPKHGLSVNIPNIFTFKFGRKYFSTETFDKGLPIRIETNSPITVTNILFCAIEGSKLRSVLHNVALPDTLKIEKGIEIITLPWKEVNKASLICLEYEKHKPNTSYYLAIYDQFTDNAHATNEPFVPFVLNYFALAFDPEFDQIYEKQFGFSLKALMRAKTLEERQRLVGLQIGKPENPEKTEKKQ